MLASTALVLVIFQQVFLELSVGFERHFLCEFLNSYQVIFDASSSLVQLRFNLIPPTEELRFPLQHIFAYLVFYFFIFCQGKFNLSIQFLALAILVKSSCMRRDL